MTNVPSGWYPNPHNPGEEMYWDGTAWAGASRKMAVALIEDATMVRQAEPVVPPRSQHAEHGAYSDETVRFSSIDETERFTPRQLSNGFAIAALILGCCGAVFTVVPFLIGLVLGGIPDILAILFGVLGVLRGRLLDGKGIVPSIVGGTLGCLSLVGITLGAGWLW